MDNPSIFFALAIAATIGYSLQSTLMTSFYREIDRLSAVALRGLSLGITMSPLLLFVDFSEQPELLPVLPTIFYAAIAAALGNWCAARAFSYLPVGIASALSMSFATINVVALGYFAFDEILRVEQLALIGLILLSVFGLGITRSTGKLPPEHNVKRGIVSAFFFGIFLGGAYTIIGSASRQYHPLAVGYLWEFTIGILAAAIALARQARGGQGLARLPLRRFLKLMLFSSPTVLGTGAYITAMSLGPVSIATAIISTMMVFNTLLARVFYGEKLSRLQWAILLFICAVVATLRYSTA